MGQRISPSPVLQYLDEGGDVIATMNADGSVSISTSLPNAANAGVATQSLTSRFTVTSTQLLALKTTPVQLIPAPALANQIIFVENVNVRMLGGGTAYTLNAGNLKLFYGAVANGLALTADMSGVLTTTVNNNMFNVPGIAIGPPITDANGLQQGVFLGNNGTANYTLGNGSLVLLVTYNIVNVS